MATYEKWNDTNTILLNVISDPDAVKLTKMDKYLLVVTPSFNPTTEKLGSHTFTSTERSWEVLPLSIEEITTLADASLAEHLDLLLLEANIRVGQHIAFEEKAHWMGVADAISRKQSLYVVDQLGGNPDLETYPPLTSEEQTTWANLATIQKLTAAIRDAAADIEQELYQKTNEEVLALDSTWVSTHILWP